MSKSDTALLGRLDVISAAAVIAAHANSPNSEFRQRDVRFLIELLSNWIEHSLGNPAQQLKNTQISRYLEQLVDDGLCSKTTKGRNPIYKLQRIGVVELLGRITQIPKEINPELNFLACYFILNYHQRLWALVEQEGRRFPLALRIELESLLDYSKLIEGFITQSDIEIRKLKVRISDALSAAKLTQTLDSDYSATEIAKAVEKDFPYELNSQKPLSELIAGLSEEHGLWELGAGTTRRVVDLWQPSLKMLESYREALVELKRVNSKLKPKRDLDSA